MQRTGMAHWDGDLKGGRGELSVGSGGLAAPYSWGTRFGDDKGTNPEELIGAAHAACFSMALAADLGGKGATNQKVETRATVSLDRVDGRFTITGIALAATVSAEGIAAADIRETAASTVRNCPVSRALAAVPVTLTVNGEVTGR